MTTTFPCVTCPHPAACGTAEACRFPARVQHETEGVRGVSDEWVMVPRVATDAMVSRANQKIDWCRSEQTSTYNPSDRHPSGVGSTQADDIQAAYTAMLSAAPVPPPAPAPDVSRLVAAIRGEIEWHQDMIEKYGSQLRVTNRARIAILAAALPPDAEGGAHE